MFETITQFQQQAVAFAMHFGLGVLVFLGFWLAAAMIFRVLNRVAARSGAGREDVLELAAQISRTTLVTFGTITALGTIGLNVSALVAGLGLTGFALGFAFRDALSNVLAGAMILFYRPFHRRDFISVSGFEGVVAEINLRYTIVRTPEARVLIPNSNLLTNPIVVREAPAPESEVAGDPAPE
ncbi:MAG: small conductance mechanosensitive channel [Chthoniobacter sp.]|jgi:small-conductance mechanosensitive channel|nr:small conductance mechanosensitive channel [Chthoniobacter sp.]